MSVQMYFFHEVRPEFVCEPAFGSRAFYLLLVFLFLLTKFDAETGKKPILIR